MKNRIQVHLDLGRSKPKSQALNPSKHSVIPRLKCIILKLKVRRNQRRVLLQLVDIKTKRVFLSTAVRPGLYRLLQNYESRNGICVAEILIRAVEEKLGFAFGVEL